MKRSHLLSLSILACLSTIALASIPHHPKCRNTQVLSGPAPLGCYIDEGDCVPYDPDTGKVECAGFPSDQIIRYECYTGSFAVNHCITTQTPFAIEWYQASCTPLPDCSCDIVPFTPPSIFIFNLDDCYDSPIPVP
jgi:hypothetical protein